MSNILLLSSILIPLFNLPFPPFPFPSFLLIFLLLSFHLSFLSYCLVTFFFFSLFLFSFFPLQCLIFLPMSSLFISLFSVHFFSFLEFFSSPFLFTFLFSFYTSSLFLFSLPSISSHFSLLNLFFPFSFSFSVSVTLFVPVYCFSLSPFFYSIVILPLIPLSNFPFFSISLFSLPLSSILFSYSFFSSFIYFSYYYHNLLSSFLFSSFSLPSFTSLLTTPALPHSVYSSYVLIFLLLPFSLPPSLQTFSFSSLFFSNRLPLYYPYSLFSSLPVTSYLLPLLILFIFSLRHSVSLLYLLLSLFFLFLLSSPLLSSLLVSSTLLSYSPLFSFHAHSHLSNACLSFLPFSSPSFSLLTFPFSLPPPLLHTNTRTLFCFSPHKSLPPLYFLPVPSSLLFFPFSHCFSVPSPSSPLFACERLHG